MRSLLCWIRDTYGNPKIIITENGVSNKRRNEDEDTFIKIRYHYVKIHLNSSFKLKKKEI